MRSLILQSTDRDPLRLLCIGAHPDDIEIGCGGSVLQLLESRPGGVEVTWCVLSGSGVRAGEASESAQSFLADAQDVDLRTEGFRDGFFPWEGERIKEWFEALKNQVVPDLIFTHHGSDLHQDHRLVSELTWNTFRDHLILEYEVPKYDGDLGSPNLFVPLSKDETERKWALLHESFPSQRKKHWFDREVFFGLMRLRAVEAGSDTRYAEAFHLRKAPLRLTESADIGTE